MLASGYFKANPDVGGKPDPLRPTSKDKPDGTRKDGSYLRCLNDCVPRKQGPPGAPDAKDRADCLDDCQVRTPVNKFE